MTVETSNSTSFVFNPPPPVSVSVDVPARPVVWGPGGELHPNWVPTTKLPLGLALVSDRKQGEVMAAVDRLVIAAMRAQAATQEPVDVWGSLSLHVADEIENFPRPDSRGYVQALITAAVLRLAEGKWRR